MEHFESLCKARCLSLKIRLLWLDEVFRCGIFAVSKVEFLCKSEEFLVPFRTHNSFATVSCVANSVDEINVKTDWWACKKVTKDLSGWSSWKPEFIIPLFNPRSRATRRALEEARKQFLKLKAPSISNSHFFTRRFLLILINWALNSNEMNGCK